jgi:hypothetical protein
VLALAVLWGLARVRFPDRPVTPGLVPPLLTQFTQPTRFADLASEISLVRSRLDPLLAAVRLSENESDEFRLAVRFRDDFVVLLLPDSGTPASGAELVGRDPASGLALVRLPGNALMAPLTTWIPREPNQPRYLMAVMLAGADVALRPLLVSTFEVMPAAAWSGPVWRLPPDTTVPEGSFLFTNEGALAGLVIDVEGTRAVASAESVLAGAEVLGQRPAGGGGSLGLEVQALTSDLAEATGASIGAVVTWVDPGGPAKSAIRAGDVIESVDDAPLAGAQEWRVRTARLRPGERVKLRIRRDNAAQERTLTAVTPPAHAPGTLGVSLQATPGAGARVLQVIAGSPAARAGLRAGDLITVAGATTSPTPAQVERAYDTTADGRQLLLAITRGESHRVVTVSR